MNVDAAETKKKCVLKRVLLDYILFFLFIFVRFNSVIFFSLNCWLNVSVAPEKPKRKGENGN